MDLRKSASSARERVGSYRNCCGPLGDIQASSCRLVGTRPTNNEWAPAASKRRWEVRDRYVSAGRIREEYAAVKQSNNPTGTSLVAAELFAVDTATLSCS